MKKLQKGFVVPLLIAIIAVLAIGSAIYFWQKDNQTTPQLLSQDEAVNLAVDNVIKEKITTLSKSCISASVNGEATNTITFDLREVHSAVCGGDPNTTPLITTVTVNLSTKEITPSALSGPVNYNGTYEFVEAAPGLSNSGQPNMVEVYELKLQREENSRDYIVDINVDGFQTLERLHAGGIMSATKLTVFFDSYSSSDSLKLYKKGDILFDLELPPVSEDKPLKIDWNKMQPNFDNTDKNNSFFTKTNGVVDTAQPIQQSTSNNQNAVILNRQGYYQDHDYLANPNGSTGSIVDLVFASNQADKTRIVIPNDVAIKIDTYMRRSLTGASIEGETLSAGLIVSDPKNVRDVYLSTTNNTFGPLSCDSIESIYKYNLNTNILSKIFTVNEQLDGQYNCKQLRIIGIQGNNIIMNKTSPDDSPGPCYSPLTYNSAGGSNPALYSLNIDNPNGLIKYSPSASLIANEIQNQQKCQANL